MNLTKVILWLQPLIQAWWIWGKWIVVWLCALCRSIIPLDSVNVCILQESPIRKAASFSRLIRLSPHRRMKPWFSTMLSGDLGYWNWEWQVHLQGRLCRRNPFTDAETAEVKAENLRLEWFWCPLDVLGAELLKLSGRFCNCWAWHATCRPIQALFLVESCS